MYSIFYFDKRTGKKKSELIKTLLPTIIGTSLSYTGNQTSKAGERIDWIIKKSDEENNFCQGY